MAFVAGLDLGKLSDFTALAVLDKTSLPVPGMPGRMQSHYFCGLLKRWPKRTPYVGQGGEDNIVDGTRAILSRESFRSIPLAIDQTGVGVAVVDFFRRAKLPCRLRPITITAGATITKIPAENGFHVPKKELVSTLEILLQNRRLTVARSLPDGETLRNELANFQMKITKAANESFGTWRDGEHDDIVLAVALAAWLGEHSAVGAGGKITVGRSAAAAPAGVYGSYVNERGE